MGQLTPLRASGCVWLWRLLALIFTLLPIAQAPESDVRTAARKANLGHIAFMLA